MPTPWPTRSNDVEGVTLQEPIGLPAVVEDDDLHPLQWGWGEATEKGAHRHHGHLAVAGTSRSRSPP
jgi:hypothetical protein